jgi:hypothetical protein
VIDHHHSTETRSEHVMLELGDGVGALVVYADAELHAVEVEISPGDDDAARAHKQVHERLVQAQPLYAAVFDRLAAGAYTLWLDGAARTRDVRVDSAVVTEIDWRTTT